ncbi:PilN domain-containing protein [Glaciecola sp. KUL10]|jgi:type IV pilus assembly protein PilN|uniref:PilN domain-containing protein n=1 Tax=Glaciecola sp. (strain KUL10) TaxID=2161813 RepID=UPI000D78AD39|nr:PilN domain-containing protein [Glaciecola sp. KUL10]GBL03761.1 type IV pilus biogenesis protein PilN [Glaciecola sp. KUL10]
MAHVNLLPWREEQRQKDKKQYLGSLIFIALIVFLAFWLLGEFIEKQIRNQEFRNNYLNQEISILDAQIARIRDIKTTKSAISQRMALIEQLQVSRNVSPIMFDELARIVPNGVSFEKMSRNGNRIELVGISESNNRLSSFMRNLQASEVFTNGELSSIKADAASLNAVSNFKLTFSLSAKVAPVTIDEQNEGTN